MNGTMSTKIGNVVVDHEVIAKYAGSAAIECFGVVGMASVSVIDGLAKLLRKDNISHGVNVKIVENKISIELHIIVSYGVNIAAVAGNLKSNVKYKIEEFTGIEVEKVDIIIEGVRVID